MCFLSISAEPAKPQNLTGMGVGSEIALAWRPPPPRDRNGDITAYEIKWTIPSTLSEVLDVMVKANETHRAEWNYTIPAVQRGGTYKVAVAAINEAGTGEYATIEVLTPPPPSTGTYIYSLQSLPAPPFNACVVHSICVMCGVVWSGVYVRTCAINSDILCIQEWVFSLKTYMFHSNVTLHDTVASICYTSTYSTYKCLYNTVNVCGMQQHGVCEDERPLRS